MHINTFDQIESFQWHTKNMIYVTETKSSSSAYRVLEESDKVIN